MADGQLPYHSLEPLLRHLQIDELSLGALKVCRQSVPQLLLKLSKPCWCGDMQYPIPQTEEGFVKRLVKVDQVDKPSEWYRFGRILIGRREADGRVQAQGPVRFERVRSALPSASTKRDGSRLTHLSVMNSSQ